jgi:hypothetical protein
MRALLIPLVAVALGASPPSLAAPPAAAPRPGTPVALAERQVTSLEFSRPVVRLATTDPDLLALEASGTRLRITALRAGRAQVDVVFEDGGTVTLDVTVDGLRRPVGQPVMGPGELELGVGEERRVPSPGLARVLVEENGVARVRAEGAAVVVLGVSPGRSSVVLVDEADRRVTLAIRVR